VHRLIALMDSVDERVAVVACNSILDRAFGKPGLVKEEKDSLEVRVANMTRAERLARMRELLEPMRAHLHELDDEQEAEAEVTMIESGDQRRRRRPSAT
jgi:hypothetical protein